MPLRTDFKIGADTSGFRRGLASIRQDARKLANDINKSSTKAIGKQIKHAIGPIAVGTAALLATKTAMEEAKAVRDNAAAHKLSIEEEQAAEIARKQFGDTANVTAEQFAEAVKKIIESGQVMSTDVVKQLAASQDEFDAAAGTMKRLFAPALVNLAESMVFVVNSANKLRTALVAMFSTPIVAAVGGLTPALKAFGDAWRAEGDRQDFAKRLTDFNAGSREVTTPDSSPSRFNAFLGRDHPQVTPAPSLKEARAPHEVNADALQRIGLFIGGLPSAAIGIQKQQLSELKAIRTELKNVKSAVDEI